MTAQTRGDPADKIAIREVLEKYCRGIDRRDFELVRSCYHEEAFDEHGTLFRGSRDAFVNFIGPYLDQFSATTHHLTNALIDVSGDTAESESYILANHVTKGWAPQNIIASGRYLDKFDRRDGRWRIIHRTGLADWSTVSGGFEGWQEDLIGVPGPADASFRLLNMFG